MSLRTWSRHVGVRPHGIAEARRSVQYHDSSGVKLYRRQRLDDLLEKLGVMLAEVPLAGAIVTNCAEKSRYAPTQCDMVGDAIFGWIAPSRLVAVAVSGKKWPMQSSPYLENYSGKDSLSFCAV